MSKVVHAKTCPTCNRGPSTPYRVIVEDTGEVIQGCVDHFHTGHLKEGTRSNVWHNRPEAARVRDSERRQRGGYVTEYAAD